MNPSIRSQFKACAALLVQEAAAEIEQYPEQRALLEATIADGREVRLVWHTLTKDISVEIVNADGSASEVLRDRVILDDGFAKPESMGAH
jgi:hypothetical protein